MISRKNTTRLTAAARCLKKRRIASCHWLRSLTVNSRSIRSPGLSGAPTGCSSTDDSWISSMADPRVQDAVQDVGDQVEQDHDGGRDDQPTEHHVEVDTALAVVT